MSIQIGKEIEKKFQESGLKISAFSEMINTGERNVYTIFSRNDISAELLKKISEALKFNFFDLYKSELSPNILSEPEGEYYSPKKGITVSLNVVSDINTYSEHFSSFLSKVHEIAIVHGFKLS